MNILVASVYSYNSYSRGIMPDVLQTQINENPGATIYYLTDSGSFDISYFNIRKKPEITYLNKVGVKNALELVSGKFQHLKISAILRKEDYFIAEAFFKGKEKVEIGHVYENFEVGAATISTYISQTRDRDLIYIKQDFVKELAINALALYLATRRFLREKNIEVVYNFNGRQEYVRAIMRATMAEGLNCYNVERARIGGFLEFFKNVLPHNILAKKALVDAAWDNSELSKEEKYRIASSFFERQRSGESVIFKSYIGRQKRNIMADEIPKGKNNIVVYNSSDDEYAALGEDFENPIFKNQFEGIDFLVDLFGKKIKDYNLIIRMHPNLAGVEYEYAENIRRQHQKFPNIFVVLPESETDSYALITIAEKIITFGSTFGVEATYYGKPTILLGKTFHYYSNATYTPRDTDEILELLKRPLKAKPKENALKFGYYYLTAGVKANFYFEKEFDGGVFFKGVQIPSYSLQQRIMAKLIQKSFMWWGIKLKF